VKNKDLNKVLVSVIMPVYNCAKFIDEAITSIVNQTYRNLEIFIIDDCSSDGTIEIISNWAKIDSRINIIFKNENLGYVDSLNLAIRIANGKYLARMDGDDICYLDRIEKQVLFLENNPTIGVLGTGYRFIGSNKSFIPLLEHDYICIGLLLESQMAHPTVMFRKSVLETLPRLYNDEFTPTEDYEFWIYLSNKTKLANLSEILLEYRVHENNISKKLNNEDLKKSLRVFQIEDILSQTDKKYLFDLKTIGLHRNNDSTGCSLNCIIRLLIILSDNNKNINKYNVELFDAFILGLFKKLYKREKLSLFFRNDFNLGLLLKSVLFICKNNLKGYKNLSFNYSICNSNNN
jgi:glycosyltransferase involved in cell wall biosynthesis